MASSSNSGSLVAPLPEANANIPPLAAALDPMEDFRGGRAAIVAVASAGLALLVMAEVWRNVVVGALNMTTIYLGTLSTYLERGDG